MAVFVIFTILGAFVRIPLPFTPVPLTLQTMFVLLSGAYLGGGWGSIAQLIYLCLGILGLPVFSGAGSGLLYLSGPTAGYIWGFVLAAFFVGRCLRHKQNSLFFIFAVFCLGDLLLLLCGLVWLKIIFVYPLQKLLFIGFLPFLAGDLLKAWAASLIYFKLAPNRFK